jgi:putative hydrolase of the HAD superfamily
LKKYKHIFFDLDRTLWDYEKNSGESIMELLESSPYASQIGNPLVFIENFHRINDKLWDDYRKNLISKEDLRLHRFHYVFLEYGIDNPEYAFLVSVHYSESTPRRNHLVDGCLEVLDYLSKKYILHIITNGFSDTQCLKIESSGLGKYFSTITTSDLAGEKKPNPGIFHYALQKSGALASESLMIGDQDEVDVAGARQAGLDQVLFDPFSLNHHNRATYLIKSLKELLHIL